MGKIKRGTKRFNEVVEQARDIRIYSLDNHFSGIEASHLFLWGDGEDGRRVIKPVTPPEFIKHELTFPGSYLYEKGTGAYGVRIHSNLWYEFSN